MKRTLLLLPCALVLAQAPPGWKEFSIGPATKNASRFNPREGLRSEGIPLRRALARAWGIDESLVVGPEWIANQRYAITALISGAPETFQPLFQKELARRFHLEAHLEKRDTAIYALRIADDAPHRLLETIGVEGRSEQTGGKIHIVNGTLAGLAQSLSSMVGRPVRDETGIQGRKFDIDLTWNARDPSTFAAAVQEQLGLRAVETKAAIEFLVIDRVEQLN